MIIVNKSDWKHVKSAAKNCKDDFNKLAKNLEVINTLLQENERLDKIIKLKQTYVISLTGFTTEELLKKEVVVSDKTDKEGNIIKVKSYKYVLNEDRVSFDEESNTYRVITDDDKKEETEVSTETHEPLVGFNEEFTN